MADVLNIRGQANLQGSHVGHTLRPLSTLGKRVADSNEQYCKNRNNDNDRQNLDERHPFIRADETLF